MTDENEVYVEVRPMLRGSWPAQVIRQDGATLVNVEAFADRYDVARWLRDNLDDYELDWFREAMQWPEGAIPTAWLEEVGPMALPESLWLPLRDDAV